MSQSRSIDRLPVFRPGQVLCADDFNQLGAFLREQQWQTQRELGFGIMDGLDAEISDGREWRLSPGKGLDFRGRTIEVDTAQCFPLPPYLKVSCDAHPLIVEGSKPDTSFTAVLKYTEFNEPIDDCTLDKAARGEQLCPSFELQWFSGLPLRLPQSPFYDFAPLRPPIGLRGSARNVAMAEFAAVLDLLVSVYAEHGVVIDPTPVRRHGRATSPVALQFAALNDLVFTGWQLARAEGYLSTRMFEQQSSTAQSEDSHRENLILSAGIPLGSIEEGHDGNWRWNRSNRFAFHESLFRLASERDYPAREVREFCVDRAGRLARLIAHGFAQNPNDAREFEWISSLDQRFGLSMWHPDLNSHSPRLFASLWPTDPVSAAPQPKPIPNQPDSERGLPAPGRFTPSWNDPQNDPYLMNRDADTNSDDTSQRDVLRLTRMMGLPLSQVRKNADIKGVTLNPSLRASDGCVSNLSFVLLAGRGQSLVPIVESPHKTVVAFAHASISSPDDPNGPRPPHPPPERFNLIQRLWRWLERCLVRVIPAGPAGRIGKGLLALLAIIQRWTLFAHWRPVLKPLASAWTRLQHWLLRRPA